MDEMKETQDDVRTISAPRYKPKLKMPTKSLILDLIDASFAGLFALRDKGSTGEADRLQRVLGEIREAMRPKLPEQL
jgi:hypothetical protein